MLRDLKHIPLLLPFYVIYRMLQGLFCTLPLVLVGFWWCDRCKVRYNFRAEKFEETACGYDGEYVIDHHCEYCEEKERGK